MLRGLGIQQMFIGLVILAALLSDALTRHASLENRLGLTKSSPLLPEIMPLVEEGSLKSESLELTPILHRPLTQIMFYPTDSSIVSHIFSNRERRRTLRPDLRHACGQQAPPLA